MLLTETHKENIEGSLYCCDRIIKKVGKTYKYYLTAIGKTVIAAGLAFKNLFLVPALA